MMSGAKERVCKNGESEKGVTSYPRETRFCTEILAAMCK